MGSPYLVAYNGALTVGWGYVLYLLLSTLWAGGWTADVYQAVDTPLKYAQTAAALEIFHSLFGVVKAPFFTTFIQVLSRFWALWGIVNLAPEECSRGAVRLLDAGPLHLQLNFATLMLCWSLTEVLRYGFFAAKELGVVPYPLLWLRYSLFYVLYPLGVASEMTMVYLALPRIRRERPLSPALPNALNFGFDYYYACWLAIACYVPGLPELYLHMVRQRRKILGGGRKGQKAA